MDEAGQTARRDWVEQRRAVRLLVPLAWLGAAGCGLYAWFVVAFFPRPWVALPLALAALAMGALPTLLRRTGDVSRVNTLGGVALFLAMAAIDAQRGFLQPAVLGWMLLLPAGAALSSLPTSRLWTGVVAVWWIVSAVARAAGVVPAVDSDSWPVLAMDTASLLGLLVTFAALLRFHGQVSERAARELRMVEQALREDRARRLEDLAQLAGGIAHDFNNLLTAIGSHSDLAADELAADHPVHEDLLAIGSSVRAGAALAQQLSAFSGSTRARRAPYNLAALLSAVPRWGAGVVGEGVQVELDLAPDLLAGEGDVRHLERVLRNLVTNAADAMPHGGRLSISAHNVEPSSDGADPRVRVEVRDTGQGMTSEVLRRSFDPFFSTRQRGVGHGLGLAICQALLQSEGGSIEARSEPGQGTVFTLLLRATRVQPPEESPREAGAHEALRGRQVLVVDDEPAVRRVMARALEARGVTCVEAYDADSALALMSGVGPAVDAVVTDVMMPGRSGPELATELRAIRPGLPVLYVSGHAGELMNAERARAEGAGFLGKPFARDELVAALVAVLEGAGRSDA